MTTTTPAPEKKGLFQEFKDFIATGDLMTIAVAFIMGVAIKAVIDSFVNDIVMGIIGLAVKCEDIKDAAGKSTGKKDCTGIAGKAYETVKWGSFINQIVVFLLTALAVFALIKFYRAATKRELAVGGPSEVDLLTEIRDELRSRG
ncbi:MAG: MscL family protein [Actinomycetota bacterium]|jgi:large conductance mechanosensitive channel